jgi:hypothetical protein
MSIYDPSLHEFSAQEVIVRRSKRGKSGYSDDANWAAAENQRTGYQDPPHPKFNQSPEPPSNSRKSDGE